MLDVCNGLSELLSLPDSCAAAPPDSGWHCKPWLVALCRCRALAALGSDRAGRQQPGPPAPTLSAARRASHPATGAPGTAASTDTLTALPPPSPLPAATGTAMPGLGGNRKTTLEESNTKPIPSSGVQLLHGSIPIFALHEGCSPVAGTPSTRPGI